MIIIQLRIQYNEQNVQSGSEQNVQNLVLNNSSKLLTGSFPSFSLWCWLEASTISLTVWGQSWQWKTALKIKCVILKKPELSNKYLALKKIHIEKWSTGENVFHLILIIFSMRYSDFSFMSVFFQWQGFYDVSIIVSGTGFQNELLNLAPCLTKI